MKYAKLAGPRLFQAQQRPRLSARLAELAAGHPVVWVAAPPGAGKSTTVAGYLADAGRPHAWYQLDQGDADPATLFYFLEQAVAHLAPAAMPAMPAPQATHGSMELAFFRGLYARLPQGAVLVLDNAQEFDWTSAGALLALALAEVPPGINVIVVSREAPPARLSRMELAGQLGVLGWAELKFDRAEAVELAQLGEVADAEADQWIGMVDGWAAGIVMLRQVRRASDRAGSAAAPLPAGRDAVFRYFAGEIFERMDAGAQRLLLLLSCLPGLSADDAEQLTGSRAAPRLLEQLYHDRLFTERRGEAHQTYHFHALFRQFLQHQADERLAPGERIELLQRAGAILERRGRVEEAAQLYQDARDHPALVGLLLRHAPPMLARGRGQAWREWMGVLPADLVDHEPWLRYWHAMSLTHVTPVRARHILSRTAESFRQAGHHRGRVLAVCAIIDTYDMAWTELSALGDWVADLGAAMALHWGGDLDASLDLRLHSRLVLGLLLTDAGSPSIAPAAERALAALARVDDPVERLGAGAILLRYYDWTDNSDTAKWLVAELEGAAQDPGISPVHRVWWYGRVARWYTRDGQFLQAGQVADDAKAIVASFGLDPLLFQFLEATHLLGARELDAARAVLDTIRGALDPARKPDWLELHALEMEWHALSGDTAGALQAALSSVELAVEAGVGATSLARTEALLAALYALAGDFPRSTAWYDRAERHAVGHDLLLVREERRFVEVYAAARQGDEAAARALLRQVLAEHRLRKATSLFATLPRLAAELAALGLKHGIETEHLRAIVQRQKLAAPSRDALHWPWPVAVRTLGKFEMCLHGETVVASGKAQQRPLMLLKALVGAGAPTRTQKSLYGQLWPDGDDPKSSLNVTVHRLRKLLGGDQYVGVTAGSVFLDQEQVWSDVGELSQLCNRIDAMPESAPVRQMSDAAARLLDLYRGSFCEGEDDSWLIPTALRWRNRFVTSATRLGQHLEDAGQWQAAAALYQRALDAEPLAEAMYRGVMRCAHAQSDAGAALSAYRRCKETLSIVMGRTPSGETEALALALGFRT